MVSSVVEMGLSGVDRHEVLIRHVPVRRRWWLLVRRPRCEMCGTPYPCWSRRQAYRSLAAGPAVSHLTAAEVAVYPPDDLIADAHGWSRLVRSFIPPGYVDRGGNELGWTGR